MKRDLEETDLFRKLRILDLYAQNDQDSVRESVNAWISGLGYF
ncbi:hypothetical protein [Butyrivibrio sp. WCE2006]